MNSNTFLEDTIVGISTTVGRGAISIIRLSGDKSIEIVNSAFKGKDLRNITSSITEQFLNILPPLYNLDASEVNEVRLSQPANMLVPVPILGKSEENEVRFLQL